MNVCVWVPRAHVCSFVHICVFHAVPRAHICVFTCADICDPIGHVFVFQVSTCLFQMNARERVFPVHMYIYIYMCVCVSTGTHMRVPRVHRRVYTRHVFVFQENTCLL